MRWLAVMVLLVGLTACGGGSSKATQRADHAGVIRVPQDAKTISAAVAKAEPGELVLVSPGTYSEMVQVKKPRVTVRGLSRAGVIIDGGVIRPNGIVLTGAGDVVQNLTVRNAVLNGVLVTGDTDKDGDGIGKGSDGYSTDGAASKAALQGFLVDHVTSYDNGLYGIYAFDAQHGAISASYTSGMADSGIYVGQCQACDITVTGNVAERNAVGYEGTNASGSVTVVGNRFVGNRVGATTDSDHQEAFVPQDGATIAGNVIAANQEPQTPEQADGGFGIGLGIAGGTNNKVVGNLIVHNAVAGIEITSVDDLAPIGNQVLSGTFADNGVDVAYTASAAAPGSGNCVEATVASLQPPSLPRTCPASGSAPAGAALTKPTAPKGIAFTDVAPPPTTLPDLPDPATAAAPTIPGGYSPVTTPDATLLQDQSSVRW